jgi:hypothetical protein
MKCITYNEGYKYQLKETYKIKIDIKPKTFVDLDYVTLDVDGMLTIKKGYAWDGPSGPTIDTLTFMRGSLVHDALYQLMRENKLEKNSPREQADQILQKICKEDGIWSMRAWWVFQGVRLFADPAADPASKRPAQKAPKDCAD